MNAETAQEDVMSLAPGAGVLYDEPLNLSGCATIWFSIPFHTTSWSAPSVLKPSCASWSRT